MDIITLAGLPCLQQKGHQKLLAKTLVSLDYTPKHQGKTCHFPRDLTKLPNTREKPVTFHVTLITKWRHGGDTPQVLDKSSSFSPGHTTGRMALKTWLQEPQQQTPAHTGPREEPVCLQHTEALLLHFINYRVYSTYPVFEAQFPSVTSITDILTLL